MYSLKCIAAILLAIAVRRQYYSLKCIAGFNRKNFIKENFTGLKYFRNFTAYLHGFSLMLAELPSN